MNKKNNEVLENLEIKDVDVTDVVENNIEIDVKSEKKTEIWNGVKKWGGRAALVILGAVGAGLLLSGDSDDEDWEDEDDDYEELETEE